MKIYIRNHRTLIKVNACMVTIVLCRVEVKVAYMETRLPRDGLRARFGGMYESSDRFLVCGGGLGLLAGLADEDNESTLFDGREDPDNGICFGGEVDLVLGTLFGGLSVADNS